MFNIGGGEILVIALIALIAVGPEQLPGVMRKVGGFVNQIRTMTTGIRDEFMSTMEEANPNNWVGDGSDEKPIVPRGYAENAIKSSADPAATAADSADPSAAAADNAAKQTAADQQAPKATFDNSTPAKPAAKPPVVEAAATDEGVDGEPAADEAIAEDEA